MVRQYRTATLTVYNAIYVGTVGPETHFFFFAAFATEVPVKLPSQLQALLEC